MAKERDSEKIFRVYQRARGWQKLIVMIPASFSAWVDTCLHPCVLGTRMLWGTWRSRVAYYAERESADIFRQRISDIRVRFVQDPSVAVDQRCYMSLDKSSPIIPPGEEVVLLGDRETALRFPMERGRIQVRLAGAKPTDEGVVRIDFLTQTVAADDWFVFKGVANNVEVYDLDLEQFPEPREPNPFAGMQADQKW